jgi:hypothetical protein
MWDLISSIRRAIQNRQCAGDVCPRGTLSHLLQPAAMAESLCDE